MSSVRGLFRSAVTQTSTGEPFTRNLDDLSFNVSSIIEFDPILKFPSSDPDQNAKLRLREEEEEEERPTNQPAGGAVTERQLQEGRDFAQVADGDGDLIARSSQQVNLPEETHLSGETEKTFICSSNI